MVNQRGYWNNAASQNMSGSHFPQSPPKESMDISEKGPTKQTLGVGLKNSAARTRTTDGQLNAIMLLLVGLF